MQSDGYFEGQRLRRLATTRCASYPVFPWALADRLVQHALQYKGRAFKVANFNRWLVIVSGPNLIDDVRKAADHELSFLDAANEVRICYLYLVF